MGDMDGRAVTRALNAAVRPILREAGFDTFSGRNAWRRHGAGIDHVGFRSFNSYAATGALGCTTFSFEASAGVRYQQPPPDPEDRPSDFALTFRGAIRKYLRQPIFHPYGRQDGFDRPEVWYVLPDGSNLDALLEDVCRGLREQALPYLTRLSSADLALEVLRTEISTVWDLQHGVFGTWIPGNPGSPSWVDAHALLTGILDREDIDPSTAPVLTPAQRWLVQHQTHPQAQNVDDLIQSIVAADLIPVRHLIPIPLDEQAGADARHHPRAIHVYVNPDGTLDRAAPV